MQVKMNPLFQVAWRQPSIIYLSSLVLEQVMQYRETSLAALLIMGWSL